MPSCLDWVITDDPDIVQDLQYEVPLGRSDHVCLKWELCFRKRDVVDDFKYNYWKADYSAIRKKLTGVNWQETFENRSVNDMWSNFVHVVNDCVKSHLPLYKAATDKTKSKWMSRETKSLFKKRNRAWSAYAQNRCINLYAKYKSVRNEIVASIYIYIYIYILYLIKAKGPEATYIAVQLQNKQTVCTVTDMSYYITQPNVNATKSRNSLEIIDFTISS